jgi:hypothetical protein
MDSVADSPGNGTPLDKNRQPVKGREGEACPSQIRLAGPVFP